VRSLVRSKRIPLTLFSRAPFGRASTDLWVRQCLYVVFWVPRIPKILDGFPLDPQKATTGTNGERYIVGVRVCDTHTTTPLCLLVSLTHAQRPNASLPCPRSVVMDLKKRCAQDVPPPLNLSSRGETTPTAEIACLAVLLPLLVSSSRQAKKRDWKNGSRKRFWVHLAVSSRLSTVAPSSSASLT